MESRTNLFPVLRDFHNHNDANCGACRLIIDRVNEEELSTALDAATKTGWESAREFFREQARKYAWENWAVTVFALLENDIDKMFQNPENEIVIVQNAALNRGQP